MATISTPPDLTFEGCTVYHIADEYLSNVLFFYGNVVTGGASSNSSRIQATIFTAAGWQHYPRITPSPTSPLYAAVNHLPREKQGDEVCRGIAVSVLKYFADLSDPVKDALTKQAQRLKASKSLPKMFDEMHAAEIANRMEKVENPAEIIRDLQAAYAERVVASTDIDVLLPSSCFQSRKDGSVSRDSIESVDMTNRYGMYSEVVEQLGEAVFIPTSKVRRAPSRASSTSKSAKFTIEQKEALRLAMCEIVDTEERYVSKMYDLVHSVIQECRQKAKTRSSSSSSPDEEALEKLFPPCLDEILEVNIGFLDAIRSCLEATEAEAMEDISKGSETATIPKRNDPLGAMAFSKLMREWFPKFSGPYKEYMRVQPGFSSTLSIFMKDPSSTFSKRVQETGEQKLRSLLMEPVQRLPRYSLLIDAMTATMPQSHPAIRSLLKARDIVTEICALENAESNDNQQTHHRLKEQVIGWPSSPVSKGRLIAALDVVSLRPPYRLEKQLVHHTSQMLLLFPDALVLLEKTPECTVSSRGFVANMDKPMAFNLSQNSLSGPQQTLQYLWSVPLQKVSFLHSSSGRILHLARLGGSLATESISGAFLLTGPDEGKAARFCEEVSKANIEARFSEEERSGDKWSLHGFRASASSLQLFTAVCEEESSTTAERNGVAPFQIVFGKPKAERQRLLSSSTSWAIASISRVSGRYKLEIDHKFGSGSVDVTAVEDLLTSLSRRLSAILVKVNSTEDSSQINSTIITTSALLDAVAPKSTYSTKSYKSFRPTSPTKFLASIWGGSSIKESSTPKSHASILGDIPVFRPPLSSHSSQLSVPSLSLSRSDSKVKLVATDRDAAKDAAKDATMQMLEQTLTVYVLSLRSRAGNIIGKTLRSRDMADQVAINDLYNILVEDPSKIQAAAEVSNDVLFSAFEKFLWNAWKAELGPVVSIEALKGVQAQFDSLFPSNFKSFFNGFLGNLSSQNRRAFASIIKLLADLLDASGNDGDRGALTVAFAELLSDKTDSMSYISLLDRLVDDYEKLFDDSTAIGFPGDAFPNHTPGGTINSNYAAKTGSVNSQTSSFRKRFGFGLGGKNESESKVSSIIRSLSKTKGAGESNSQPSSLSKGSLVRSRSTDSDSRISALLRPVSRDRPVANATLVNNDQAYASRPNSSHSSVHVLQAIGELPNVGDKKTPRKKRRSSLSDLQPLNGSTPIAPLDFSPLHIRTPLGLRGSPLSSPALKNSQPEDIRPSTPTRSNTTRLGSPSRPLPKKENIVSPTMSKIVSPIASSLPRPSGSPPKGYLSERAINRKSDDAGVNSTSTKKRTEGSSGLPTPKPGSRDRPSTGHSRSESLGRKLAEQPSPQKLQKLRMQSPQKLRERLNKEKQSITAAESILQSEMAKIGEELSRTSSRPSSAGSPLKASALQARVTALEAKLHSLTSDLSTRVTSVQKDLETSLAVSERRAKKLDDLYKEATAENDALYDRFNKELAKTVKNVRAGPTEGVDELKSRLSETSSELLRMKKENWRLKREIAGLKAQTEVVTEKSEDAKAP